MAQATIVTMYPHAETRSRASLASRLLVALLLCGVAAGCGERARAVESRQLDFDGLSYKVVHVDLRRDALSLHWRDPDNARAFGGIEALKAWGERHGRRLLFAANAGIYDRANEPLGLYVQDGRALEPLNTAHGNPRSGNFSLLPNGVFYIDADGRAAVRTTPDYATADAKPRLATQSGPMLVVDGAINPQFIAGSDSLKWRSGVCARTPHEVVFAISEAPVNFHTFARLFRDKLGCRDALYLDGTISQFYVDGEGYAGAPTLMVKPYAGIFAVFDDDGAD